MKLIKSLQFFNPNGEDNIRKLVLDNEVVDNSTGTWYLNDKRKTWASSLSTENQGFWEKQDEFLWRPEEISMVNDKQDFESLDREIQFAIENILSFLQYLDSIVPENDTILKFITGDYEIKQALGIHEFVEGGIHTKSYQYILKTLFGEDNKKIKEVYYRFRTYKPLAERNKELSKEFQALRDIVYKGILNTEIETYKQQFFKTIIQDYFIESTIFYMGFLFFHIIRVNLNKLSGVNQQISLIRRDEELHVSLFHKIIKTFQEENEMFFDEDIIYDIAYKTAEADKKFYKETLQDRVSGLTEKNINAYIEYTVNKRLKALGLKTIYSSKENPFQTIESVNNSSELRKSSFFETGAVDYFSTNDIDWNTKLDKLLDI